ncbi:Hpt domain-containing protein [Pontiella sp.]|uniref:Hpt domain-containing protein n=1 Tax=Pontiella sp. TaxID=2837462 RepID=UPI00356279FC
MMNDLGTLLESAGDDQELAGDLLDMFAEQARGELEAMADLVRTGDSKQMATIAHKLVGSAVACGFDGLSKELRAMELRCLQGLPDDVGKQIDALRRLFEESCIEMGALLAKW